MRKTKLGAVLASLALSAGTTAVLTAGPAQAGTATTAVLHIDGKSHAKGAYGDYVGLLDGSVTDGNGIDVTSGTAHLQAKLPGKAWQTVKTDTDPGYLYFGTYGSHAKGNVQYRVRYVGDSTYDSTLSNTVTVTTFWKLNDSGTCVGGCRLKGKLAPKARHHKVLIQVKHGSWQRYKVVKTNRRSRWVANVVATRGNGTLYRAVVAGNKHLHKTTGNVWRFYRY